MAIYIKLIQIHLHPEKDTTDKTHPSLRHLYSSFCDMALLNLETIKATNSSPHIGLLELHKLILVQNFT